MGNNLLLDAKLPALRHALLEMAQKDHAAAKQPGCLLPIRRLGSAAAFEASARLVNKIIREETRAAASEILPSLTSDLVTPRIMPHIGDRIIYRGNFGTGPATEATVTDIGHKNGRDLVSLDDNHWAYLDQIDSIVSHAESVLDL